MEIAFDPAKDAANIAKHGLSFSESSTMDMRTAAVVADDRNAYGEVRYLAFNRIDGKPHLPGVHHSRWRHSGDQLPPRS